MAGRHCDHDPLHDCVARRLVFLDVAIALTDPPKDGLWSSPRRARYRCGGRGLIAGAEGDADKARKKAAKAQSLIKSPTLGHLIRAQTAESANDLDEAVTHYTALLKNSRTKTIAEKGLVRLSMAGGNLEDVVARAGAAFTQDKPAKWAFDPLFRARVMNCLLYTSPSPRDLSTSRMPSSA